MRALHATVCVVLVTAVALTAQAERLAISLLIEGGTVITMDGEHRILSPGSIAIDGSAIIDIDEPQSIAERYSPSQTIDAAGQLVLPGLVNTHTHAPMVMYRGLADDRALIEWLEEYIFPAEAATISPAFVRTGTRLALLEMIESGTTTYADMYYFEEEVAAVTRAVGMRAVLGQTIIQFPVADAHTPAEGLARAERFIKAFKDDELIVPAVAPHAIYTLDATTLSASAELGRRYGVPILIHLAETREEARSSLERHGLSPTAYLESIGFWGPRTLAAHGVWVNDDDVRMLRSHDVGVSHNPESNMKLASGAAPVARYLAAGVALGLGTDGAASNNDLDMFEAMRQAAFLAKHEAGDPTAMPARVALELATIGGARALGLDGLVGSLEQGKRADVIAVSTERAGYTPLYDPISQLVYVGRGDDVQSVVVNGKVLMHDRSLQTLDRQVVLADAVRLAEQVRASIQ